MLLSPNLPALAPVANADRAVAARSAAEALPVRVVAATRRSQELPRSSAQFGSECSDKRARRRIANGDGDQRDTVALHQQCKRRQNPGATAPLAKTHSCFGCEPSFDCSTVRTCITQQIVEGPGRVGHDGRCDLFGDLVGRQWEMEL